MIFFTTWYIPGKKNVLANQLSRPHQVLLTVWSLLPQMFNAICKEYRCYFIDLFATQANVKLPLYISPVPDSMAWKEDTFQHSWEDLYVYAFPLFDPLKEILLRVLISQNLSMILVVSLWPQKGLFSNLPSLLVDNPLKLTM